MESLLSSERRRTAELTEERDRNAEAGRLEREAMLAIARDERQTLLASTQADIRAARKAQEDAETRAEKERQRVARHSSTIEALTKEIVATNKVLRETMTSARTAAAEAGVAVREAHDERDQVIAAAREERDQILFHSREERDHLLLVLRQSQGGATAAELSARFQHLDNEMRYLREQDERRGAGVDGNAMVARRLYLDLLESALTGSLFHDGATDPKAPSAYDPAAWAVDRDRPRTARTMTGAAGMRGLRMLVETVIAEKVPGDLLEAGVSRGGACIYMRGILAAFGEGNRTVWVADSFAGPPMPGPKLHPVDAGDPSHAFREPVVPAVPADQVRGNFALFGLLDEQVRFLEGWFEDTLPAAPVASLAVLRLHGDLYSSTMQSLEALYDRVSPGGYVIVGDYGLEGPRAATDDFRRKHGILQPLAAVDGAAVSWRK